MALVPGRPDPYTQQFRDAVALFEAEKFEAAIAVAKYNLTVPTLSRYWRMKTLIFIANATDLWHEGENYRRQAEGLWFATRRLYPARADAETESAMQELRTSLNELEKSQIEEAPPEVERLRATEGEIDDDDDDDDDDDESMPEDVKADADAEREVLGAEIDVKGVLEDAAKDAKETVRTVKEEQAER